MPWYKDSLPWRQVLSLSSANFSQAVMLTTPFTIGVFMVRDFEAAKHGGNQAEVDEQRVGRLTGLLAGIFSFSGFLTAYAWGCASNYVGRKPVIALGNAVSFISILWFGLSGSYASAMAARAFGGFLNGILGAWKCMIGESTDTLLQGKFFGYMSLAWGLGCIAGPAMGGAFSRPCSRAPHMPGCGEHGLFRVRPYFLACLVGSTTILAAFLLSALMLEETLPPELQEKGLWAKLRRWRQGRKAAQLQDARERQRLTSAEGEACSSSAHSAGDGVHGKAERRRRRRRKSRRCQAGVAGPGVEAEPGADAPGSTAAVGGVEEARLLLVSTECRSDQAAIANGITAVSFGYSSCSGSETDSSSLVDVDLHGSDVEIGGGGGGRAAGSGRAGGAEQPGAPSAALQPCPSTTGSTNRMRHLLRLTSRTFISGNPFTRGGSWRRVGSGRRAGGGSDAEATDSDREQLPWAPHSPAASPRAAGGGKSLTAAAPSSLRGPAGADCGAGHGAGRVQLADVETEAVPLLKTSAAGGLGGVGPAVAVAVAPAPSSAALELVPAGCAEREARAPVPCHSHSDSSGSSSSGSGSGMDGVLSTAPGSSSDCGSGSGSGSGDDGPPPSGGASRRGGDSSAEEAATATEPEHGGRRGAGWKDSGRSGEELWSGPQTSLETLHEDSSHHGGSHGLGSSWTTDPSHPKHPPVRQLQQQHEPHHTHGNCRQDNQQQQVDYSSVLKPGDHAQQQQQQQRRQTYHEMEIADSADAPISASGGPGDPPGPASAATAPPTPGSWYRDRQVVLTILGYGATALLFCAVDEVFPIYAAAPLTSGGLGMREEQIAPPLMFFGAVLMPYSLYGYPWLQRKVGTLRLTRVGLVFSAATCLLLPLVADVRAASKAGALVLLYGSMIVKAFAQCSAFTGSIIAVNAAPSQEQLGAVNGVGQTLAALVRGVGPALGGILWAASLGLHTAGQQFLTFVIIALVAIANYFLYAFVKLPNLK